MSLLVPVLSLLSLYPKIIKGIKNEEDVEELQKDLDKLYNWAKENNMVFNGSKFQLMRYGSDENIKNDTLYFTGETNEIIETFDNLRDLGVILSDDGSFDDHIIKVGKKVRQKMGWVMRTFYSRRQDLMKTLYKSLIVPHVDYCSQLWMPIKSTSIQTIEKLQRDFFNRIPAIKELNYWDQLKSMKMISLQRRLERYRVIYTWKILEGIAPNCGINVKLEGGRVGRKCQIPKIQIQARKGVQSLREQSFQVNGPQLFNCLLSAVRNMTKCTVEEFKAKLDTFLEKVPDEPSMRGLVPAACTADARPSNSIMDQVRRIQLARWPEDQMARESQRG